MVTAVRPAATLDPVATGPDIRAIAHAPPASARPAAPTIPKTAPHTR